MITVKATRNTYDSKNDLRDCGFIWNKEDKVWEKEFDSMESYNEFMDHFMNVTYWGCKIVNRYHSKVVFEIIEEEVVEENEEVETEKATIQSLKLKKESTHCQMIIAKYQLSMR